MQLLTATLLLSAGIASVLCAPAPLAFINTTSLLAADTLNKCTAASNCELYETEHGAMIRFKPGMGPTEPGFLRAGLKNSTFQKPNSFHTNIQLGSNSFNYGSTDASYDYGAIHHLYDVCGYSSCSDQASSPTQVVISTNPYNSWAQDANILLNPTGQYDGWDERNAFIETIVAAMAVGEQCGHVEWGYADIDVWRSGNTWQCSQTNFISVNRFASDGNLMGYMTASMQLDVTYQTIGGWCNVLGELQPIQSIFEAVPEIGSIIGAFFGIANAFC